MRCINVQAASNWLVAALRVQDKCNGTALSSYEKKVRYEMYAKDCMLAATESSVDVFEKSAKVPHIGGLDVTATFLGKVTIYRDKGTAGKCQGHHLHRHTGAPATCRKQMRLDLLSTG